VNALNIVKQGKLLLSAMGNGTIEFYRIADGEKLASLFVTKYSDWVFWTPEGYYSKSDFDTPLLGWQRNKGETELSTFYPVDRFYKDFYTPFLPEIILRTMRTASEVFSGINTEEMVNSIIERNTAEKPSSVAKKNETNDKVNLFLVSCGVANYQTEDFSPLNYAIQDAEKIEKAIAEKYKDEYKEIITYSLYDNQFTEENLNNLINTINEKAGRADHIIFFYAGHGTFAKSEKGGDYILKYPDKTGGVAIETLYKTLNSIRAEEITIFLDACNSGSAVDHIIKRRIQKKLPNTAHASRINVITSSKEWESSAEIKALEHGLFTYCLLEAIESTDGFEIDKIANELIKQMTEKSLKYLNELRIPGVFLSK